MRYGRIFLLQFQTVLQERGRAFVWFLKATISPLILILFWKGAVGNRNVVPGWDFASITSYYFFSTIAFSLLIAHVENDVAYIDIKEGMLVMYLLKPFSYYWKKIIEEIPFRLLQACYGFILCLIFFLIFGKGLFVITHDTQTVALGLFIIILASFISFTLRLIMGLVSFWFNDTRGFFETMYAIEFALGGTLLPLALMPSIVLPIAYTLPFSYILYFPIIAIQGKLGISDLLHVMVVQIMWLCILGLLYQFLWNMGVKKFSGVGQ